MSSCILSQEAMEDVYIHHMPHLCWHTLHSLTSLEPLTIKPRSLQHCLELLLFATAKIVQEASPCSSPATTTTAGIYPTYSIVAMYKQFRLHSPCVYVETDSGAKGYRAAYQVIPMASEPPVGEK